MKNVDMTKISSVKLEIKHEGLSDSFLDMRLGNLYCKHMIKCSNTGYVASKANRLFAASDALGYEFCEWGSHSGHHSNLPYHRNVIMKMESDNYNHVLRIVVCKYDFCDDMIIWTDNLHSTIKYIRQYGRNASLRDVPFYVVNLSRLDNPIVTSCDETALRSSISDVLGAVSSAYFRYEMSNSRDLIDVGYLVDDLLYDNPELLI